MRLAHYGQAGRLYHRQSLLSRIRVQSTEAAALVNQWRWFLEMQQLFEDIMMCIIALKQVTLVTPNPPFPLAHGP